MRKVTYAQAINEAIYQTMEQDNRVFVIGQGCTSPWYVGNTCQGLIQKFGKIRVIDTPVSENAITGAAIGAAIVGMRPIVVHPRMDFMMYAMDPIINEAANWHYMFGGKSCVPVVIWSIINRGGEQAAQHSQALHAFFTHVPGLKVVMPATPYDAKGLMIAAIKDDNPVVYIDDRWLYSLEGFVPKEVYSIPIGKGIIRKKGKDVTLVTASYMVQESIRASECLEKEGIGVEVIDLRSVKPLDRALIFKSLRKTKKLVVVDGGWKTCGLAAEISALTSENMFKYLKAPIERVTLPDSPAPASQALERSYYPNKENIITAVKKVVKWRIR